MRTKTKSGLSGVVAIVAICATTGCGDDSGTTDTGVPPADSGAGDTAPDASDSGAGDSSDDGALDGAMDSGVSPSCDAEDLDHLLVVTTAADFSQAGLGAVALDDLSSRTAPSDLPDTDSVGASAACTGYVLSRGQGIAHVMDAEDPLTVAHDIALDPSGSPGPYATNPQTLAAARPDKAYVAVQARNVVLIIDPTLTGEDAVLGEIDLSELLQAGDMDGLVDATDAIVVGERLYVALGHYWFDSSFAIHFEGSELAVIDTTSDTLVDVDPATDGIQGIALMGDNPWRGLEHHAATNVLWVGASGNSFAIDGHIEEVDLTTLSSAGIVVTEADVSGEINGFAAVSPTRVFMLIGSDLAVVDPSVDFIVPEIIASDMDGLLLHRDTVWAWARSGEEPGLASFDPATGAETTPAAGRFNFGELPVFDVVAVP